MLSLSNMTDFLMSNLHTSNRILIAPLDWGLGHATRCVPIINQLLIDGKTPVIAAYGAPLNFFRLEFPQLEIIELPGLQIKYPKRNSLMLKMAVTFPLIAWSFYKEHFLLKQIITDNRIDAVISDGRYGLWNRNIKSIFINHQINIKLPGVFSFLEFPLFLINKIAMSKFDEVWIPDSEQKPNLAGELSHKYKLSDRYKFVGPLSRFSPTSGDSSNSTSDILIILSGPEPARSEFESIIFNQLIDESKKRIIVVRGKPGDSHKKYNLPENVDVYNHLSSEELAHAIANTGTVISRPGYSTVMDLSVFGKKAVFVPTPGQSEQEYLARYYQKVGWVPYFKQQNFDLFNSISDLESYFGIPKMSIRKIFF
jgi:uncharacterized protein (TIGR00661 family)